MAYEAEDDLRRLQESILRQENKEAEKRAKITAEVEQTLRKYESRPLYHESDLVPPIMACPEYYMEMVGKWDIPIRQKSYGIMPR